MLYHNNLKQCYISGEIKGKFQVNRYGKKLNEVVSDNTRCSKVWGKSFVKILFFPINGTIMNDDDELQSKPSMDSDVTYQQKTKISSTNAKL